MLCPTPSLSHRSPANSMIREGGRRRPAGATTASAPQAGRGGAGSWKRRLWNRPSPQSSQTNDRRSLLTPAKRIRLGQGWILAGYSPQDYLHLTDVESTSGQRHGCPTGSRVRKDVTVACCQLSPLAGPEPSSLRGHKHVSSGLVYRFQPGWVPAPKVTWTGCFTTMTTGESVSGVGTVVMGRVTYEQILGFGEYPYPGTRGRVTYPWHSHPPH